MARLQPAAALPAGHRRQRPCRQQRLPQAVLPRATWLLCAAKARLAALLQRRRWQFGRPPLCPSTDTSQLYILEDSLSCHHLLLCKSGQGGHRWQGSTINCSSCAADISERQGCALEHGTGILQRM